MLRTLKNSDLKTLEQLFRLRQDQLKRVLARFLKQNYSRVIETKEYIFAEGDIPIALVAHMDTVFKDPPEEIFFDPRLNAMISPDGLGADDRAGVFAILQIVRSGLKPHVIFTTDEEIGGYGASAISNLDCPFPQLRYIIELDRRGAQDCVFYDCENPEFTDYVESFGFTWSWGTFSDISVICPAWGVAGVNLSIGYRDEHTTSEVLSIGHMLSTIEKVKKMLTAENIPFFEYIESPWVKKFDWTQAFGYGYSDSGIIKCEKCHKYYSETEMFPVVLLDKTTGFYCPDCLTSDGAWCDHCDSAFEKVTPEAPNTGTCPICADSMKGKKKK